MWSEQSCFPARCHHIPSSLSVAENIIERDRKFREQNRRKWSKSSWLKLEFRIPDLLCTIIVENSRNWLSTAREWGSSLFWKLSFATFNFCCIYITWINMISRKQQQYKATQYWHRPSTLQCSKIKQTNQTYQTSTAKQLVEIGIGKKKSKPSTWGSLSN